MGSSSSCPPPTVCPTCPTCEVCPPPKECPPQKECPVCPPQKECPACPVCKEEPKNKLDKFFGFKFDIDDVVVKLGYDKPPGPGKYALYNFLIALFVVGSVVAITNMELSRSRYIDIKKEDVINPLLAEWEVKAKAAQRYGHRIQTVVDCFRGKGPANIQHDRLVAPNIFAPELLLKLYMFIALLNDPDIKDKTISLYEYVNKVKYNIFDKTGITITHFKNSFPKSVPTSPEELGQYARANQLSEAYHDRSPTAYKMWGEGYTAFEEKTALMGLFLGQDKESVSSEDYPGLVKEAEDVVGAMREAITTYGKFADVTYVGRWSSEQPIKPYDRDKEFDDANTALRSGICFAGVWDMEVHMIWSDYPNIRYQNRILDDHTSIKMTDYFIKQQEERKAKAKKEKFDRPEVDCGTYTRLIIFVVIAVISLIGIAYVSKYILQPRLPGSEDTPAGTSVNSAVV